MSQQSALRYMLPWLISEVEETKRILGEDFWPYGVEANRKTIETFTQYPKERACTRSKLRTEDILQPATDLARI